MGLYDDTSLSDIERRRRYGLPSRSAEDSESYRRARIHQEELRAEAERAAQMREDLSKEDKAFIRFADEQFERKEDIDAVHAIISHAGMQARKSLRGKCLVPKSVLGKMVAKCMVPTYNAQHTVDFEDARQIDDFLYDQYMSHVEAIDTNLIFDELEELIESLQVYYMAYNPNLPKYATVISSMMMLRKLYGPETKNIPIKLKGHENATEFIMALERSELGRDERFAKGFFRISDRLLVFDVTRPGVILDPQPIRSKSGWIDFFEMLDALPYSMDYLAEHIAKAVAAKPNADLSKFPKVLISSHDLLTRRLVDIGYFKIEEFEELLATADVLTFEALINQIKIIVDRQEEYFDASPRIDDFTLRGIAFVANDNLERILELVGDPRKTSLSTALRIHSRNLERDEIEAKYEPSAFQASMEDKIEALLTIAGLDPLSYMKHHGAPEENFRSLS